MSTTDRAKLEMAINWADGELTNFTDRPVHNVEAARKTQLLLDAARAHLETLPKTKMVEVWRVEVAYKMADGYVAKGEVHETRSDAERSALQWRNAGHACIKVTGPHQQEVPA